MTEISLPVLCSRASLIFKANNDLPYLSPSQSVQAQTKAIGLSSWLFLLKWDGAIVLIQSESMQTVLKVSVVTPIKLARAAMFNVLQMKKRCEPLRNESLVFRNKSVHFFLSEKSILKNLTSIFFCHFYNSKNARQVFLNFRKTLWISLNFEWWQEGSKEKYFCSHQLPKVGVLV